MNEGAARMPTVAEAIRLHAGLFVPRDRSTWRILAVCGLLLLGLMLILPPVESFERPPIAALSGLIGPTLGGAYREYRYGGSAVLILAAAITAFFISAAVLAALFAVWLLVGGLLSFPEPFAWFFGLPMEVAIAALIGVMAFVVVAYFVTKPRRQRATSTFEAAVRAERMRRGLPTAS